ncbi:hypothetical protein BGX38DRAFT_1171796 [Terfezia claveryi]|nr:hypothetical protein BGX38DRAFT_1171796 [Terfezia claveryi]
MGTRICLYTMDTKTGELIPESIPDSSTRVTDTAPAERWSYDIMKSEGEDVVRGIIDQVKKMGRETEGLFAVQSGVVVLIVVVVIH